MTSQNGLNIENPFPPELNKPAATYTIVAPAQQDPNVLVAYLSLRAALGSPGEPKNVIVVFPSQPPESIIEYYKKLAQKLVVENKTQTTINLIEKAIIEKIVIFSLANQESKILAHRTSEDQMQSSRTFEKILSEALKRPPPRLIILASTQEFMEGHEDSPGDLADLHSGMDRLAQRAQAHVINIQGIDKFSQLFPSEPDQGELLH